MNPKSLKLHNFCAVADSEIDLTEVTLASVVGPNGISKSSTFIFAPLFCLFGKPRPGTGIDDMVKTSTQDMSVTFEFEHNSELYQITRTRKLNKKSTCEFQKQTPSGWESLTATTKIGDTDKKIEQLLSLDYDTFVASSLILQGDASNFTKKYPSERKQVLSSILGLEIYEKLQALAKDRAKSLELKLEASKVQLAALEEKLNVLPEVEADLTKVKQSLTLTACDIRDKESELADVQAQIKDLEQKQQEAERIEKQIESLSQEIKAKEDEIENLKVKIWDAEKFLEFEPAILADIKTLEEIKAQIPALQAKDDILLQRRRDIALVVTQSSQSSDTLGKLMVKVKRLEKDLSLRDELKDSAEQYQQGLVELKGLDKLSSQYQDLMNQIREIEKQTDPLADKLYEIKGNISEIQTVLNSHRKKLEILQSSGCPNLENATCRFLQDANEAKALIPPAEAELKEWQEEYKQVESIRIPLMQGLISLDQKIKELQYDSSYHADLKNRVESLRQKAEQYASLVSKEELLQNLNEQRESLSQRITALDEQRVSLNAEIKTLEAETESLPILKAKIPSLEVYAKQKDKLPEAKAEIKASREQIAKLESEIEAKAEQQMKLNEQWSSLMDGLLETLAFKQGKLSIKQTELKQLQQDQNRLFASQGALTNQFNTLTLDKQKHDSLSQELAPQAKELVRWQTLVKAFGKNGIPALIIENAIPELERISNDILGQMSGGAHTLQFVTQRDAKSKDSTIETLDILVSDWAGTRPFESYSGGEQTRISLAIRFALSELLANRAGSKIEWIVGDEILSDQSPEFRDMTIESIKSLTNRFKKILIISHIPEIQTAFDQRIILSEGGKVQVEFN